MDNLVRFQRDEENQSREVVLRTLHTHDGAVRVGQRPGDGYINVTALCKAAGKQYQDWRRLARTQEYLDELSSVTGIPVTGLLIVVQGGTPYEQGTWGHPRVSLRVAQWCSPKFEVQVDGWLHEGMGNVEAKPVSGMDLIRHQIDTLQTMFAELEGVQKRQELIEAQQTLATVRIDDVDRRLEKLEDDSAPPDHMTALAFCRFHKIRYPKAPQALGVRASQICAQRHIQRYEVPDPRWGTVGSYSIDILKESAQDIGVSYED